MVSKAPTETKRRAPKLGRVSGRKAGEIRFVPSRSQIPHFRVLTPTPLHVTVRYCTLLCTYNCKLMELIREKKIYCAPMVPTFIVLLNFCLPIATYLARAVSLHHQWKFC